MTAAIASGYLTTASQNGCANLLPTVNGDISLIASWADDTARDEYPWSPQLHFINTPDWSCDYEQTRDCFGSYDQAPMACVDGAIQNYTRQLATADPNYNLTEALMFLVHFIGDIHQPLHVGFTGDEGGNTIVGTYEGTSEVKLHHIWDTSMLDQRIANSFNNDNSTYLQVRHAQTRHAASAPSGVPRHSLALLLSGPLVLPVLHAAAPERHLRVEHHPVAHVQQCE